MDLNIKISVSASGDVAVSYDAPVPTPDHLSPEKPPTWLERIGAHPLLAWPIAFVALVAFLSAVKTFATDIVPWLGQVSTPVVNAILGIDGIVLGSAIGATLSILVSAVITRQVELRRRSRELKALESKIEELRQRQAQDRHWALEQERPAARETPGRKA